jgi:hypothetical protein
LLDQTYCLEDLVHIPTYDEIADAFFGQKRNNVTEKAEEVVVEIPAPSTMARKQRIVAPPTKGVEQPECFGEMTDQLNECGDCNDFYDECTRTYEERKTEVRPSMRPIAPEPIPVETRKPSLRQKLNR